jgi:hypothetical protein
MTRWIVNVALFAWAAGIGCYLARAYFLLPPDRMPVNHEQHHYVYRLVEFRDLLAAGYWSPQWATHFRGGLGGPYFGYYQPGFFYLASLVPWWVDPLRAIGCAVIAAFVFGFASTFNFISSRFGNAAGFVGATALIAAPYPRVEVIVRGDLSEFTAMMIVPFALHCFLDGLERGRWRDLAGLAVSVALAMCTHPAVGLFLGIALALSLVLLSIVERNWTGGMRVAAALAVGAGLAGFYVLPVTFEIGYVTSEKGFRTIWDYTSWFLNPRDLFDPAARLPFPVVIGTLLVVMAAFNVAWFLRRPREWPAEQRRFLGFVVFLSALMFFLMTSASALVWELFPPLPKVQFPGRALAILTPALACASGAISGGARPNWRHAVLGLLALVFLAQSVSAMRPAPTTPFTRVTRAADLVTAQYFRPDVAGEWLPRGAHIYFNSVEEVPTGPTVTWGKCRVTDFRRNQGQLVMQVTDNAGGCFVTLPHFFFPLGWRVRVDGAARGATLEPARKGLMQVGVPPGVEGPVELRFTMTPMRRVGWVVTAVSATCGLLGLALVAHGSPKRGP